MSAQAFMDQVEFEVIRENTRVLTLRRIEADTQKLNQYPYRVVTEDPDRIGLCHVFEGSLFIRGFQKAPVAAREMMKRILLEQFESDAWQYEEEISAMIEQLRIAFRRHRQRPGTTPHLPRTPAKL